MKQCDSDHANRIAVRQLKRIFGISLLILMRLSWSPTATKTNESTLSSQIYRTTADDEFLKPVTPFIHCVGEHRDSYGDGIDLVVVFAGWEAADLIDEVLDPRAADEEDLSAFGEV